GGRVRDLGVVHVAVDQVDRRVVGGDEALDRGRDRVRVRRRRRHHEGGVARGGAVQREGDAGEAVRDGVRGARHALSVDRVLRVPGDQRLGHAEIGGERRVARDRDRVGGAGDLAGEHELPVHDRGVDLRARVRVDLAGDRGERVAGGDRDVRDGARAHLDVERVVAVRGGERRLLGDLVGGGEPLDADRETAGGGAAGEDGADRGRVRRGDGLRVRPHRRGAHRLGGRLQRL